MDNLKRNADIDPDHDEMQKVKRQRLEEKISKTDNIDLGEKREQVVAIIKREFQNEITKRQDEVHLIQQRLLKAQKTLHLLKYVIIKSFYDKKELKIISGEESVINHSGTPREVNNASTNIQNRIHPAIKKLLGKKPVETITYDFARTRGQSQNIFPVFIKKESIEEETNETEEQNNTTDIKIEQPVTNINEIKVPIRNRQKIKHDVVIGNISKYVTSNNPQDSSTHKWMVYVRGSRNSPDISHFVKKVRFFLHPSYQPNDIVELEEPPFHLSRRGWGEFPLRIQIHFQNSSNKPVDVIHNLKLDQNRTGRQTLGNETLINVWLYDTSILEENESETEDDSFIKQETNEGLDIKEKSIDIKEELEDDNFMLESQEHFEPKPGCSKYINLSVTPINNIKNENKTKDNIKSVNNEIPKDYYLVYLVDHCYTSTKIDESILFNLYAEEEKVIDREKYKLNIPINNFTSIRQIVYFLFKSLPLVTKLANDPSYKCCYPYVAATLEEYCSWNYAKRCCSEWYRAKHIKKMLQDHKITDEEEWSIKFIIMFGRSHAFTPLANYEIFQNRSESGKTLPNQIIDSGVESTLTEYIPITNLMENSQFNKMEKNEECLIDVESLLEDTIEVKAEQKVQLQSSETDPDLLPMCNYIKNCAKQIEINLKDEEIEPNVFHNSAERVILQSVMCLAEELIRTAWANKVIDRKGRNLEHRIEKHDIFKVLLEREEFDIFTNEGLGKAVT